MLAITVNHPDGWAGATCLDMHLIYTLLHYLLFFRNCYSPMMLDDCSICTLVVVVLILFSGARSLDAAWPSKAIMWCCKAFSSPGILGLHGMLASGRMH
jgi:hypothetical protein